jgi:GntR family transcriptional repressor for pyruvate dehydrogenase complex
MKKANLLEPPKKIRLYENIISQLIELMKKGDLKPGDRLPTERDLALQLGVSRTAIREAFRSLEVMGFIESKVREGTFVKTLTLDSVMSPFSSILSQDKILIMELIHVRILLETEVARLAALNKTPEKTGKIRDALDAMKKSVESGGLGVDEDDAFHSALADAACNGALVKILTMCGDLLHATRQATMEIPGQPAKTVKDHKAIADAVEKGDPMKAADLMRLHLVKAYRNLKKRPDFKGISGPELWAGSEEGSEG